MATIQFLNSNEIDNTYAHQIDFENVNAQNTFWQNQVLSQFETNITTSRLLANGLNIFVGQPYSKFIGVNYCRIYQDGRYWYFFITNKEYINENNTQLFLEMDVFQTFMFEYEIAESFIDREHQDRFTTDLKPIYNLKVENLEIGRDYEITQKQEINKNPHIWYYVYATEPLGTKELSNETGEQVDVDASRVTFIRNENSNDVTDFQQLNSGYYLYLFSSLMTFSAVGGNNFSMIPINKTILSDSRVVKIIASRYIPKGIDYDKSNNKYIINSSDNFNYQVALYDNSPTQSEIFGTMIHLYEIIGEDYGQEFNIDDVINQPSININNLKNIDNEPKLNTHPYSVLRLNIFNKYNELYRENFSNGLKFRISQGLINSTNLLLQPLDYLGENNSNFNILRASNDGEVNLITDAWEQYRASNSASINGGLAVAGVQAGLNLGLSYLTGGLSLAYAGSQAISYGGQIANELIKRQDIKNTPDEVKTSPNDSYTPVLLNKMSVSIEFARIKEQFRKTIFSYFYTYGYKANEFKKPNTRSRYYFNYIKTIGANIKSNLDNEYISKLNEIYNNGITIWHYRDANTWKGMYNYEYENAEMNLI